MQRQDERYKKVLRMQDNLPALRKLAGWTAAELADMIGVTKQCISNIERKKSRLTLTQFIAIRATFEDEIVNNKDNENMQLLAKALVLLLDTDDDMEEQDYDKLKAGFTAVAAMAGAGSRLAVMTGVLAGIAATIPAIAPLIAGTAIVSNQVKKSKKVDGK